MGSGTLGRLLASTKRVGVSERKESERSRKGRDTNATEDLVTELLESGRARARRRKQGEGQRMNVPTSMQGEERRVYVLGDRPAANKAVPEARRGCLKKLTKKSITETSRRRMQKSAYIDHYKEFVEEEDRYDDPGRDRGEAVMESSGVTWTEGIGRGALR